MQGLYWMIACVAISFASYFLLARGYSNSEIGVIMAAAYILGLFLQPLVAGFADRSTRLTPTAVLALVAVITGLWTAGLLLIRTHCVIMSILYVLFVASQLVMQPLINAYAFYVEQMETVSDRESGRSDRRILQQGRKKKAVGELYRELESRRALADPGGPVQR